MIYDNFSCRIQQFSTKLPTTLINLGSKKLRLFISEERNKTIDENEFFRQAALKKCGNLDFGIALQDYLLYFKKFMPINRILLNLYEKGRIP